MRRHERTVRETLRTMAQRYGIKVYQFANVGSHLHLLLRPRTVRDFHGFLRSFAGLVARRITGAQRGRPCGRFFAGLAWSRIVAWGRDFFGVRHYVFRNEIEGACGPLVRRAFEEGPTSPRTRSPP